MAMRRMDIEFTRDGLPFRQSEVDGLVNGLGGVTDLLVVAHGWNNDIADARKLYNELLGNIDKLLDARAESGAPTMLSKLTDRTYAVCQVFWPSKKFTDEELIPGGGAASATTANTKSLQRVLKALKQDPKRLGGKDAPLARAKQLDRALAAVPRLAKDAKARRIFVEAIRAALKPLASKEIDDGSAEFFKIDPEKLFKSLSEPVVAPVARAPGGATAVGRGDDGGAAGLKDLADGVIGAARRIANFATYYQMKERAGRVGSNGLAAVLRTCRKKAPHVRLHLVGHSFGGRLVTAAADGLPANTPAVTVTLLQAAFSHNALSGDFGKGKAGFYRKVLSDRRVSGPILITHTKNDNAVGIAYPLASRIAQQVAAALGDENDPYGGMGRNGAQHTAEAAGHAVTLGPVGEEYSFAPGSVYNLRADQFISGHSDVRNGSVAYAVLSCTAAI
jgi:pimeloyl-ACP methyl ester carboxylesterase